ncbi:Golgi reassembly-stacking protein 2 [Podila epicladia]|nr:Golgi reassembly-stacking protein 2 [Podila epicladia]KAG0100478.1 Golgi reassembly-stacking protein 2 [Podila epicladia]
MGNTTSGEEGRHRLGYHVLQVKEDSPAYRAGIRPFFDYIVAINGIRLNEENSVIHEQMQASEEKSLTMDVYSTREQAGRRVEMIPTRKWGDGTGGLLGCSIRFCMFDAINDVVWHILDVAPGSPAERAGLCAHSDYVIGTPYGIMRGEGDLYDLVEDNVGEPLRLHVYNTETDHVREIVIVPHEGWGGEGLLGCDVGYGYLHRLPRQGSAVPYDNSTTRTMSLPYPDSDHPLDVNIRSTLPASFQPGHMGFDQASRPSDISDDMRLQGLPLRFSKGERPDSDNEPDSEDEYIPRTHTFDQPTTRYTPSEYAAAPPPVITSIAPPASQSVDPPTLVPTHVPQPFVTHDSQPGPQSQPQHFQHPQPQTQHQAHLQQHPPQSQPHPQPPALETAATEIISSRDLVQDHEPTLARQSLTQESHTVTAMSQPVYPTHPQTDVPSEQTSYSSEPTVQPSIGGDTDPYPEVPTSPHKPYGQLTEEDVNQGEIPFGTSGTFSFESQIQPTEAQPPKEESVSETAPNVARNMSPPRGIAARMMHSPHGQLGGRLGPDGHSLRGAISLAAAQSQAQESELYQQEKQKADEEYASDEKKEGKALVTKALLPIEDVIETNNDQTQDDPPKRKEEGMDRD